MSSTAPASRPQNSFLLATGRIVLAIILVAYAVSLVWRVQRTTPANSGEYAISKWLMEHRTPVGDVVARSLSWLGSPEVAVFGAAALCIVLFVLKRRAMALIGAVMMFFSWLPADLLKNVANRARPGDALQPLVAYPDPYSYPSGHTAFAAALMVFVLFAVSQWGTMRLWKKFAAIGYVALMGWSRVYAGAHWTFDVLGGAFLSGGLALLMSYPAGALWRRAQRQGGYWAQPHSGPALMTKAEPTSTPSTEQ